MSHVAPRRSPRSSHVVDRSLPSVSVCTPLGIVSAMPIMSGSPSTVYPARSSVSRSLTKCHGSFALVRRVARSIISRSRRWNSQRLASLASSAAASAAAVSRRSRATTARCEASQESKNSFIPNFGIRVPDRPSAPGFNRRGFSSGARGVGVSSTGWVKTPVRWPHPVSMGSSSPRLPTRGFRKFSAQGLIMRTPRLAPSRAAVTPEAASFSRVVSA
mmetsp:Transcript_6217/g.28504  ORF Transcript_6217/g.28504 Transcript_6217/m.28504 type:complete len:217 (+) Transcript_6217:172-822(+)